MNEIITLPGDQIASIEEFEAGRNTFDDGDKVRATTIGIKELDKKQRIANVKNTKTIPVPKVGDIVIGTVTAVMSSMIAISVNYINGKPITSGIECVCSTRNIKKKNIALINDIVALKVISHINGTIHATINEPSLGVLFTKCRKCGGKVVQFRDAIKCKECGWIDERKISSDFENSDFIKLE